MFSKFKAQVKEGARIRLFLTTGEKVEGVLEKIGDDFVVVRKEEGKRITIFEKLIGGWETEAEFEVVHTLGISDSELDRIDELIREFKGVKLSLKLKQPVFSFPLKSLSLNDYIRGEIKRKWDKIINLYHYYIKRRNLKQLEYLARELRKLGEIYPVTGVFYYDAGCFVYILDKYREAMRDFEKAFEVENLPDYVFNLACAALQLKDYEKAYNSLVVYFETTSSLADVDAWITFCKLIFSLKKYTDFKKIVNSIMSMMKNKQTQSQTNFDEFQLLCKSVVYLLRENGRMAEAVQLLRLLDDKKLDFNKANSMINFCLENLSPEYSTVEPIRIEPEVKKPLVEPIHSKTKVKLSPSGFIIEYDHSKKFGFISDGKRWYFFHRSSIIDDDLLKILEKYSSRKGMKLPVVFEKAQGIKGPVAVKVSKFREIGELYKLALKKAEAGEYPNAIYQIKKVLSIDPNYKDASNLLEKWREYSRISGVPSSSKPYARAKRAELVERDLEKAERLFREAIAKGDNVESALKDLASILDRQGRTLEAIKLLEKNERRISNRRSFEHIITHLYQKVGQYDKAIALLRNQLVQVYDKEKKAQILFKIGYNYFKKEDYVKAEDTFLQVAKLDPGNIAARRYVAISLSKQERYREAKVLLNQILDTFPDTKAAELLKAIQEMEAGESRRFEEIITETSQTDFSGELSGFAKFFLDRCDFQGINPSRIKATGEKELKTYAGSEFDARDDIKQLESLAKKLGTRRPRERAEYYLTAARISLEVGDDLNQFYKYLCRSFASRGDAAILENKPLDTAREWYCEALRAYDGFHHPRGSKDRFDEQDAVNALCRFLYSFLGRNEVPTSPPPRDEEKPIYDQQIRYISETVERVVSKHPQSDEVFGAIAYLIFRSQYATNRILSNIYGKSSFMAMALDFLKRRGVPVPSNLKDFKKFVELWIILRRQNDNEMISISSELRFLKKAELSTTWLEDAIERIKAIEHKLLLELDKERIRRLKRIFEVSLDLSKQALFEEKERLCFQIEDSCQDMLNEIEDNPTRLSIEEIYPVVRSIKDKIKLYLDDLYETSVPLINLRLAIESYIPDDNQRIEVQIVLENSKGRSPAESIELVVQENESFNLITHDMKMEDPLRGGEQKILKVPIRVTRRALKEETFSMLVSLKYMTRSGDTKEQSFNLSVRLYPEDVFEEIKNPYARYAEGGIVADPEMFYGREELINNIFTAIQQSKLQSKCIVIFGQKRSGKSSILYHLKRKFENEKNFIVLDLGNIGSILDESTRIPFTYLIFWSILNEFKFAIEDKIEAGYSPLNLSFPSLKEFYEHPSPLILLKSIFDGYVTQASKLNDWKDMRIVLLIDEFSYIYDLILKGKISELFMKNWKALLQENYFSAVLAGQDVMPKFKQKFPNEFGTTQDERVSYLRREDAIKLIDEPIRIGGKKGESRYRERAIERILDLTAGSPFYIQIICNRLVEYMNRKRAMLVTEADVEYVKNELVRGVNALGEDKFDNLIDSGDTSEDAICREDILNVLKEIARNSKTGACSRSSITCETNTPIDKILDDLVMRDVLERERGHFYQIRVGLFKEWLLANQ